MRIDASGQNVDISGSTLNVNTTGAVSINSAAASNFTTTSGNLTLHANSATGNVIITAHTGIGLIVNSSGKVGIGTTTPANVLDVSGGVAIGGAYSGTTAPTNGLIVQGGVGIGKPNVTSNYALDISGNVQATSYNAISDIRLKTNIQYLSGSLELVNQLNGVSFNWINDTTNKPIHGLIAQDVEKVLPDIVNTATIENESGYKQKSIHYDGLFPHLIESIKSLTQENNALVAKVDVLTKENNALVEKVDKIITIIDKLNIPV
jgi:hypothetical protein